jgi:hypothetical protein
MNDFFAPPPFKAAEALVQMRRQLLEWRLQERAGHFEHQGQALLGLQLDASGAAIEARHAQRGGRGLRWEHKTLSKATDVRQLLDAVKRQLSRSRDDE